VWRSSADSEAVEALMVEVEGAVEVPTPSLSFHQPPPPYRSRLPLYPVPPPSLVVPPPPLPSEGASMWGEAPPALAKAHSWPQAGGDSACAFQQRRNGAKLRSKLDPNSTPFVPTFSSTATSLPLPEEVGEDCEVAAEDVLHRRRSQEEDPLPRDPASLLPADLDTTLDELDMLESPIKPRDFAPPVQPKFSAPILSLTDRWGTTRPPLLPTPPNFPPYGPRTLPALCLSHFDDAKAAPKPPPEEVQRAVTTPSSAPPTVATFTFPEVAERRVRTITEGSAGQPDIEVLEAKYGWPPSSPGGEPEPPLWTPDFPPAPQPSILDLTPELPEEYLTAGRIGGKVPPVELQRSHTDLLFFLFYAGHGDRLQLTAASLLFERGWRFNIPNQVWLARWPGITPTEKNSDWEEGLYQYFDPRLWRRIPATFRLHYSELAEKTVVAAEDISPASRFRTIGMKV